MSHSIPSTYTAISISAAGAADVLVPVNRPVPVPQTEELLVKVAAAGVNRADILQRRGLYPPPPGTTDIPGLEVSGTVVAIGSNVPNEWMGRKVVALLPGGGYSQFCIVHLSNALPLPGNLDFIQGAAVPEATFTVWHNLWDRCRFQKGESILIHGGTSGIGTTAIQLARWNESIVFVTAGSDEKCRAAEKIGAHVAINYKTTDFVSTVLEATGNRGVDVVLDMVGVDYFEKNLRIAAEDGRLAIIASLANGPASANLGVLLRKRLTITGSTLRNRSIPFKASLARAVEKNIWPLISRGIFRPVVDGTFPLLEAARAHKRMELSEHVGKIILVA